MNPDRPIRLAVLISGGGTTLANLLRHIADGRLAAKVAVMIASNGDCGGIDKAERAGVDCTVIRPHGFAATSQFSEAVFDRCRQADVELVVLGGFLSLLEVPDDFRHRVMNIHPSLIPAFCGKGYYGDRVHQAVIDRGVKVTGCTVHFVDNEYDHGPIILQRTVDVADDDTPQSIAKKVFTLECDAYPEAIQLFAAGKLDVVGRCVRVTG